MNEQGKNIPFFIMAASVFFLLKLLFRPAGEAGMYFLLKPTSALITLITGAPSTQTNDGAFLHESLNIIIDRSCSGFNFALICFALLSYLLIRFVRGNRMKLLMIPASLLLALPLSILVNSSRIVFSLFLEGKIRLMGEAPPFWLHQASGIFINLSFLIIIYLGIEILFSKLKNEKSA